MGMNFTFFIVPILLWMLALIIGTGKANFLIAGYNTASKDEKDKIDEKALCKFMRKFLFILGAIHLIPAIAMTFNIDNFNSVVITTNIIFIIVTIIGVIYMNTGKRFEK